MIFSEGTVTTVVNGTTMAMAETVAALLSGRVSFRDLVATGRPAAMQVACFEYGCYRCNAISMILEVEREIIEGPCGTTAESATGQPGRRIAPRPSPRCAVEWPSRPSASAFQ
jgi:hypothetical protein